MATPRVVEAGTRRGGRAIATVVFYGKPGCRGNARQVRVLESSGHQVELRNLLSEPWTEHRLRGFFGAAPVADWFNRSAVRVKSGEIVPEQLTDADAMAVLLADPALIRRPLLEALGERHAGWTPEHIAGWIGLGTEMSPGREGCAAGAKHDRRKHQPSGSAADPTER